MSDKTAAIRKALQQLDPANADHWTNDGLPRLDAIKGVSGLKREDVTAAAPHFSKDNPTLEANTPPAAPSGPTAQGAEGAPTAEADQAQANEGDDQGDDGQATDADDANDAARGDDDQDNLDDDISDIGVEPGEFDEAEAAVEEARKVLDEAQEQANAAKKVVDEAQAKLDALITARDAQRRPHQDMEDRLAFIKRQQQMRAARAGASAELLKGLDVSKLDPRSPLDRSMARKTGFGHRPRPQVPLKTAE